MRAVALVIALLVATGCGRRDERRTLPAIALDLPHVAPAEQYARLVGSLRELGYPAAFAEEDYGVIGVHSRVRPPQARATPISFVFQCYLDGHVVMTAIGGPAAGFDDRTVVDDGVRREAVALVDALSDRLGP